MPKVISLFKQTFREWSKDNVPKLAAALAYYTAFSLAPLVVVVIGLVGMIFRSETVDQQIFSQVSYFMGEKVADTLRSIVGNLSHYPRSGLATIIGVIVILFGAAGVFSEIQSSLNTIWKVPPKKIAGLKNFIKNQLLSFAMVLAVGFLLIVSLVFSAILSGVVKYAAGILPGGSWVWQGANFFLSFFMVTFLFALIFKVLPNGVSPPWKDVWIGAGITSFLFTLGKTALGIYLGQSSLSSIYGAAGSFVIILVWVYYAAQILYWGAEFTHVYSQTSLIPPLQSGTDRA